MYHGGRQFKIKQVYQEGNCWKVKLEGMYNCQLVNRLSNDTVAVLRLKKAPLWKFMAENERVKASILLSVAVVSATRGDVETWQVASTSGLQPGMIGKIGYEYVQIQSVGSGTISVKRGYIDSWLGFWGIESQYLKPMAVRIATDNSILQAHNAGEMIEIDMRKCWHDYYHPCNGHVCAKKRTSITANYRRNTVDEACCNTLCRLYYAGPVSYSSTVFHEMVHRVATREGRHKKYFEYAYYRAIKEFYLTEVDGPSLMACLGKFGLIDAEKNIRHYGWHDGGSVVIDGETYYWYPDGETIDYRHPHDGGIRRWIPGAYYYDGSGWINRGGIGEFVSGGDLLKYQNSSGVDQYAAGFIYLALSGKAYRNRHLTEITDPSLSNIMGMKRLSLYSWGMKPVNAWSGVSERYKKGGGF
jgi:hypothetical protein